MGGDVFRDPGAGGAVVAALEGDVGQHAKEVVTSGRTFGIEGHAGGAFGVVEFAGGEADASGHVHFVQGLDVIDIAVLANAFEGKFAGEPDLVEAKRGPGAGVKSFGVGLAKVAAALLFSGVEGVEGVDGAEKGAQGGGIVAGFDLGFEHAEAVEVFDGGRVKLEGFADPQAKAFAQGFAVQGGFLLAAKARQCKGGVVVKVGHARGAAVRRLQLESALAQSEGLTGTLQVAEGEDDSSTSQARLVSALWSETSAEANDFVRVQAGESQSGRREARAAMARKSRARCARARSSSGWGPRLEADVSSGT